MSGQNIATPQSLIQTTNGKRFYVFSGQLTVTSAEISMINVDNIGERDIIINLEMGSAEVTTVDFTIRVKINSVVVYIDSISNAGEQSMSGYNELKFICPANTSLDITLQSNSAANRTMTIMGHGKYLSIE